eukprot:m.294768 g.294768  ORF g.294768 m.294768 type:complete len:277 (-) comp19507_c0_seq2:498-1328(-)
MAAAVDSQFDVDVVQPPLLRVGKRMYRQAGSAALSFQDDGGEDYDHVAVDEAGDEEYEGLDIVVLDDGQYQATVTIAPTFYPLIIGRKGQAKARLESDTRTSILVPRRGSKSESVTVRGKTRAAVASCCTRLELLVSSASETSRPTHFVSIPLVSPRTERAIAAFRDAVLADERCAQEGITPELFCNPRQLHLTVAVLRLNTTAQVKTACRILEGCVCMCPPTRTLRMQGLEYMNDDPSEVCLVSVYLFNQTNQNQNNSKRRGVSGRLRWPLLAGH